MNMRQIATLIIVGMMMLTSLTASDFDKSQSEQIEKRLVFDGSEGSPSLKVDNVFGSIRISTHEGRAVLLKALKTIEADSDREIEKAKREVSLDIRSKDNSIEIIVDGPFRKRNGSCNWNDIDYIVRYDFDIQIPKSCNLKASTVNNGDIQIDGLCGHFRVSNVNGKISMSDIDGYGKAHTVNGSVQVDFRSPPREACSFHTINGDVALSFTSIPSADFWCKTFNGSVYSDFDLSHLRSKPGESARKNGMFVYKSSAFRGLRGGRGGAEINGDLLIAKTSIK